MKRIGFFLVGSVVLAGCSQSSRDEYSQAGHEAAQAIKSDTSSAVKAVKAGTDAASKSFKGAAPDAGKAAGNTLNAVQTPKVKADLMAAKDLDTSKLNVDTVGKVVYLKGSVPSAAQKHKAEAIAKKAAGSDFQVKDELSVSGK